MSNRRELKATPRRPLAIVLSRLPFADRPLVLRAFEADLVCVLERKCRRLDAEQRLAGGIPSEIPRDMLGDREPAAFVWFNFCRWRVLRLVERLRRQPLGVQACRDVVKWQRRVCAAREGIALANKGLVIVRAQAIRRGPIPYDDWLGIGYVALMRAVDRFDVSTGYKFSSYACAAINRELLRARQIAQRSGQWEPASLDEARSEYEVLDRPEPAEVREVKDALVRNTADLTGREFRVLRFRYGLDGRRVHTLAEAGHLVGVSKELVRQIQLRALDKLRAVLDPALASDDPVRRPA